MKGCNNTFAAYVESKVELGRFRAAALSHCRLSPALAAKQAADLPDDLASVHTGIA